MVFRNKIWFYMSFLTKQIYYSHKIVLFCNRKKVFYQVGAENFGANQILETGIHSFEDVGYNFCI